MIGSVQRREAQRRPQRDQAEADNDGADVEVPRLDLAANDKPIRLFSERQPSLHTAEVR